MSNIFIIHGTMGNPHENWFPWLKQNLEELGHEAIIPQFPTPENQSLNNWDRTFDKYKNQIDEDTIFVGHSLAPAFILDILQNIDVKIKASFFVAGFLQLLNDETFDNLNHTFVENSFDWGKIRNNCNKFFIYHADNDPYVPIECAHEFGSKLDTKPEVISNAGHFNTAAGYTKFEKLLHDIKSNIAI